jgi:hypothetical protein
MYHKDLPFLIIRTNKKVQDYFTVDNINFDFVKEWAESRGTPYVPQDKNQTTLFELLEDKS